MTRPPDSCTYELGHDEGTARCNRMPISADFIETNDLHGEKVIASLCSSHDRSAAKAYAASKGYVRRERRLTVVEA